MSWRLLLIGLLFGASTLPGCHHHDSAQGGTPAYRLKLWSHLPGNRFTYFNLDGDGMLHFAGGRDAAIRSAQPVAKLTPEQLAQIWQIIEQEYLLHTPNHPFKKGQDATYDLSIGTGLKSRSARFVDNEVPGIKCLHDALFEIQADKRFPVR